MKNLYSLGLLSLCLLFLAAEARSAANLITHGPRDRPRVALTFDLCQIPGRPAGFDDSIVRILETLQVPATFFAGGDWMRTHPDEIRRMAANPLFEIGNHSWSHPDLRRLSREKVVQEVHLATAELERLTGRTTTLFRLPYGYESEEDSPWAGAQGHPVGCGDRRSRPPGVGRRDDLHREAPDPEWLDHHHVCQWPRPAYRRGPPRDDRRIAEKKIRIDHGVRSPRRPGRRTIPNLNSPKSAGPGSWIVRQASGDGRICRCPRSSPRSPFP